MAEMSVHAGYAGAFGIKKETVWNTKATPPSKFIEIESETFDETRNWVNTPGIDGTRSRAKHRSAATTLDPRGGFRVNGAKGADLALLLELALGNYGSGTGYVGDTLPSFTAVIQKGHLIDVFTGCRISSLDFDASDSDQALKASIEAVAAALLAGESGDLGTPSYADEVPLVFLGSTIKAGTTSVQGKSWKLSLKNKLDESMFRTSRTRVALPVVGEREVTGEVGLDWNAANTDLVMANWRADGYAAMSAEFTNGVYVVTFVCPNCRWPMERGKLANKDAIGATAKIEAFSSGPGAREVGTVLSRDTLSVVGSDRGVVEEPVCARQMV